MMFDDLVLWPFNLKRYVSYTCYRQSLNHILTFYAISFLDYTHTQMGSN